jgi:hypothetical protein
MPNTLKPNLGYAVEINKLETKIENEIKPFLDKLFLVPQDQLQTFKMAYLEFKQRIQRSSEIIMFVMKGQFEGISKSPINEQVLDLFFFLGLVESYGNCYVDLLVMLIIANGRDFHIESLHSTPRIRHVTSITDLQNEKVPLTTKLHFLKDNNLATFSSVMDSQLRNDIAHLNFKIDKDKILIRGKSPKDIVEPCYDRLMAATIELDYQLHKVAVDLHWDKPDELYGDLHGS